MVSAGESPPPPDVVKKHPEERDLERVARATPALQETEQRGETVAAQRLSRAGGLWKCGRRFEAAGSGGPHFHPEARCERFAPQSPPREK